MNEADLKAAIANLEAVLNAGATTVAQDGHTTVFNLRASADRLRELKNELSALQGVAVRRPLFTRFPLG